MSDKRGISFARWRMERAPYTLYVGLLALAVVAVTVFDRSIPPRLHGYALFATILLIAVFPLAVSMRFKAIGLAPIWPLLPAVGIVALLLSASLGYAGVGGAPSGADSSADRAIFVIGMGSVSVLVLMALYALLPVSMRPSRQTEARADARPAECAE